MTLRTLPANSGLLLCALTVFAAGTQAQTLVAELQKGGYVIVMRHASSPREVPAGRTERDLDDAGRTTATAFGNALRDLKIPIGEVFTSPTLRAREMVRLARLPNPRPVEELGDNGQSMSGGTQAQAAWLRKQATQFPTGTNTVLVTHLPNLTAAFPEAAAGMADGEALIFAPDGKGGAKVLARVKIDDWAKMRP